MSLALSRGVTNKTKMTGAIALAAVLALPAVAGAERVVVTPASGINIHMGYLEAAQDVFRTHLIDTGRYDVVLVQAAPGKYEVSASEAIRMAREAGAGLAAVVHVTRLGETARVRLTVYSAATGQAVHRDQLAAATPDDIDPVLARLARGLATGKSAKDTADIETVTQRESDPLLKVAATSTFGVKLGFVAPQNTVGDSVNFVPGGSLFWFYDVRTFLAEIDFGFHNKDDFTDVWLGLGTYYPLDRGNVSPYLGGGLKWIASAYGGDGESGIQLFGTAGVLIGRLSTVQLRGELQYYVNTFAESDYDKGDAESYSHGLIFNVGIGM